MNQVIDDFSYVGSTLGNALHGDLTLSQVFSCIRHATNVQEFDAAVSATIRLTELTRGSNANTVK